MKIRHLLLFLMAFITALPTTSYAQISNDNGLSDLFSDEPEFLPVEQAFVFDFAQRGNTLTVKFDIADGYYLYKKQFKVVTKNAEVGEPTFPAAEQIEDEFFGISDVFYNNVEISYPILSSVKDGVVKLRYQGCAEAGLCYPPTTQVIYLSEVTSSSISSSDTPVTDADKEESSNDAPVRSSQFELADRLSSKDGLLTTLLLFLALGLGLAFTPCVFPMYPILSSIVIGQGKEIKLSKAFWMSFVYVQGMAITYSILGLVVASAGVQFQAMLQHPAVLGVMIALFIALSAAMFGAYEIQLPSSWQVKLNNLSNSQKSGNTLGVFVMGVISGLVASPCTTAPLTAILLFIAQSGDMVLGFVSLYVLSLGMGIPLILFGMTGGKLLPKAGAWMNIVKVTFGFMMLTVAILFVERMWISDYTNLLWAALGLIAFSYYYTVNQSTAATFAKGARNMVIFVGLFASAMFGYINIPQLHSDVVYTSSSSANAAVVKTTTGSAPASNHQSDVSDANHTDSAGSDSHGVSHPEFLVVKNLDDFREKLAAANAEGKSVMVDLYADWCVACKEFEKYTFPAPTVVDALSETVWMQIDLTDNTPVNIEFQKEFFILGLPTILFFDKQGNELSQGRITGFMKADPFADHVNRLFNQ